MAPYTSKDQGNFDLSIHDLFNTMSKVYTGFYQLNIFIYIIYIIINNIIIIIYYAKFDKFNITIKYFQLHVCIDRQTFNFGNCSCTFRSVRLHMCCVHREHC